MLLPAFMVDKVALTKDDVIMFMGANEYAPLKSKVEKFVGFFKMEVALWQNYYQKNFGKE
jgi:hypothetical protein